jgi:ADP-ribose pyrophosphatase YjhB (NUDIX family)
MSKSNSLKLVARALIFDSEGKILLGKRAGGQGEGKWSLIGGKPEEGESMEEAIIREVKEEIGVDFIPELFLQAEDSNTDPPHIWQVCYFKGPISGEFNLAPREVAEIQYFSLDKIKDLEFAFSHNKKVLLELLEN